MICKVCGEEFKSDIIGFSSDICSECFEKTELAKNVVYAFIYCPCIHESTYVTVSLHYSEEGAKIALNKHKEEEYNEWLFCQKEWQKDSSENELFPEFGEYERWAIERFFVLP